MSKFPHDENTKVVFASAIASIATPTEAEIEAGTDLTAFIPKDGLNMGGGTDAIDQGSLDTRFDAEGPGTWNQKGLSITFFRDDATDTAWETFDLDTAGFLVIFRADGAAAHDFAGTEEVEVYPVTAGKPRPMQTAKNEPVKFTVDFFVTGEPDLTATVAAGS